MAEPRPESCATCRFWKHVDGTVSKRYQIGLCRRYAPRPVLEEPPKWLEDERNGSQAQQGAFHPQTDSDDWCGEWEAKVT